MNLHEFYIGKAFDAYEYFGAHLTKNGVLFRVYAPNAEKIEVIGENDVQVPYLSAGWNCYGSF